ncbi:MAG TPA: aminoglycoside phosphotransferase, partial [Sulfitobacter pontiacus]|nr:aminoglycoside phosphotransferase [Sulfitobacter pontiacus]
MAQMNDRMTAMDRFLADAGWAQARRDLLAGDASNRRYDRLT